MDWIALLGQQPVTNSPHAESAIWYHASKFEDAADFIEEHSEACAPKEVSDHPDEAGDTEELTKRGAGTGYMAHAAMNSMPRLA